MYNATALGPLMVDVAGLALTTGECTQLRHPAVGGVILFARNYASRAELEALVADIHRLRSPRLLVAVDQEGGRVQRFRDEFTALPALARLGKLYAAGPAAAVAAATEAGWLMAAELRSVGIDFSFAPVLDVATCDSEVIGDRAFHHDPEVVAQLAAAYIAGMRQAGMASVGKHFPGHGGVREDSHRELPVDPRSYAELERCDLVPYRRIARRGLDGVMTAHVLYPLVDDRAPTFSPRWLREELRGRLGFEGVIFSDDLAMDGASCAGDPLQRARTALAAGCDMVLMCNDPPAAVAIADGLGASHTPNQDRLSVMAGRETAEDPSRRQAALSMLDDLGMA